MSRKYQNNGTPTLDVVSKEDEEKKAIEFVNKYLEEERNRKSCNGKHPDIIKYSEIINRWRRKTCKIFGGAPEIHQCSIPKCVLKHINPSNSSFYIKEEIKRCDYCTNLKCRSKTKHPCPGCSDVCIVDKIVENIYGCRKTGFVHVCDGKEEHPIVMRSIGTGDWVCVMSGLSVYSRSNLMDSNASISDCHHAGGEIITKQQQNIKNCYELQLSGRNKSQKLVRNKTKRRNFKSNIDKQRRQHQHQEEGGEYDDDDDDEYEELKLSKEECNEKIKNITNKTARAAKKRRKKTMEQQRKQRKRYNCRFIQRTKTTTSNPISPIKKVLRDESSLVCFHGNKNHIVPGSENRIIHCGDIDTNGPVLKKRKKNNIGDTEHRKDIATEAFDSEKSKADFYLDDSINGYGTDKDDDDDDDDEEDEEEDEWGYVEKIRKEIFKESMEIIKKLFDPKNRKRVYDNNCKKIEEQMSKQYFNYIKECKKKTPPQAPYLMTCFEIVGTNLKKQRLTPPITVDENLMKSWQKLIVNAWSKWARTPFLAQYGNRVNKSSFILGMLFWICHGFNCENVTIIPNNSFLSENFPQSRELPFYGYNESHITNGRNLIRDTIDKAVETTNIYCIAL